MYVEKPDNLWKIAGCFWTWLNGASWLGVLLHVWFVVVGCGVFLGGAFCGLFLRVWWCLVEFQMCWNASFSPLFGFIGVFYSCLFGLEGLGWGGAQSPTSPNPSLFWCFRCFLFFVFLLFYCLLLLICFFLCFCWSVFGVVIFLCGLFSCLIIFFLFVCFFVRWCWKVF